MNSHPAPLTTKETTVEQEGWAFSGKKLSGKRHANKCPPGGESCRRTTGTQSIIMAYGVFPTLEAVKRIGNLAGLDPVLSSAPRDERADSQTKQVHVTVAFCKLNLSIHQQ
jgi:hypothetical protein